MRKIIFCSNKNISRFFVAIVSLLIIGCGSTPQPETVEKLTVAMVMAKDINPNEKGVGNPLKIAVYSLKNSDEFVSSDFFSITEDITPSLQEQMVKVYEGILLPQQTKKINLVLNRDITAIGVVAAYRDIEQAEWKTVIYPLPEKRAQPWYSSFWSGKPLQDPIVQVNVDRLSISIKEMD